MNQRWRARRDSYRPAGEVINTAAYEVAALEGVVIERDIDLTDENVLNSVTKET